VTKMKTWTISKGLIGRVFYQGYIPEELHKSKSCKLHTKFPFKIVYFLGVKGMASSCIVYDYITRGTTDLQSTYVLYIQYIYISIHLFISNAIKMRDSHA